MSVVESLLYDYERAATALSMTPAALRNLVSDKKGPAKVKIGTRVYFKVADLVAWIDQHRVSECVPDLRVTAPANTANENQPQAAPAAPAKRRRGRPTKAEERARAAHFERRAG